MLNGMVRMKVLQRIYNKCKSLRINDEVNIKIIWICDKYAFLQGILQTTRGSFVDLPGSWTIVCKPLAYCIIVHML